MGADTSGKLLARSSILNFLNDLSAVLFFCLGADLERGSVKKWGLTPFVNDSAFPYCCEYLDATLTMSPLHSVGIHRGR